MPACTVLTPLRIANTNEPLVSSPPKQNSWFCSSITRPETVTPAAIISVLKLAVVARAGSSPRHG